MAAIAREGDVVTGVCNGPGHVANRPFTGVWLAGSGAVNSNSLSTIRVGDTGLTDCGHTFTAITGSDTVTADGMAVHRLGDSVLTVGGGSGVTVSASSDITADA